jgi:hypothetical protein
MKIRATKIRSSLPWLGFNLRALGGDREPSQICADTAAFPSPKQARKSEVGAYQ